MHLRLAYINPHTTPFKVWVGGSLLFLHQLCQHQVQRRHQADHVQLHAVHLRRGDVLPTEPNSDDPPLQRIVTMLPTVLQCFILYLRKCRSPILFALHYCSVLFD